MVLHVQEGRGDDGSLAVTLGDSLEGAMVLSRMQLRCALCGLSSGNVTEELLKAPRGLWWS
uniref:Uncharacterized protein n=1 Tax=Fagus sylvatica TaxID=28930 RepID=A0A2N9HZU6_FAGSY